VSGKPALHTPARIGVLTTARFKQGALTDDELKQLQAPGIRSIMPVNTYVGDEGHLWNMADLMRQRAMIINNTRFLDLDLILLCDETVNVETRQHIEPLQWFSLGILNPESTRTRTQLDAAMMDARTGFIYGVIGDEGKGASHSLTFLEAEAVKEAGKNRASSSARKQLVGRFPAFWTKVKSHYGK
jgi:hypothetical protein